MDDVAREMFVDTSGWYEATRPSAPHHTAVADHVRRLVTNGIRLVTTNLVVAETHALILRRVGRGPALAFARTAREPPNVVVSSVPELEARAIADWLEPYADQDFSFTDAVSFAVMRERRIDTALTLDTHFAAAGFRMIPR